MADPSIRLTEILYQRLIKPIVIVDARYAGVVLLALAVAGWMAQMSGTAASLRGLSVASPSTVWASGTAGTFLRTTDGGKHWLGGQVAGAESLDFRDVEAFDEATAILLASGPGQASRVYKTTDAGAHWKLTLQNRDEKGFFDAFAFWDHQDGMLVGDPVNGHFTIYVTGDGGETWSKAVQPTAQADEGAFAASGTCLTVLGAKNAWFGTGGPGGARVFRTSDRGQTWRVSPVPMAGIFSILFTDSKHGVAVGGDYKKPKDSARTVAVTKDASKTWTGGEIPGGYRSGLAKISKSVLVAVGTGGSDVSTDSGQTWKTFANGNFNAVAGVGSDIWAVGPKGVIAKLTFQ